MEEVKVVEMKPQLVLGITRNGPYKIIPEMMKALFEFIMGGGAECVGMPVFVCHETAEEAMEVAKKGTGANVEVAVPIAVKVEAPADMKCYELCGGKFAKIIHKGPYEACESAYNKLFKWIADNGHKVIGPTREYYVNDPREVKPEEILTEIYAPID